MPGESILIVDDTLVTLKLTRIFLASQGFHVLTASSAEEALEVLRDHHPHLVLTDIQLPGINGLELTRRIKSSGATRDIPVVALAAFACSNEEQDALKAGCDACISKPVEPRALGMRVRELLGNQSLEPAVEAGETALVSDAELQSLRDRFLEEACAEASHWDFKLDGAFDPEPAAQAAHQWIGAAGLLSYPEIGARARSLEAALRTRPLDTSELREALGGLLRALAARQATQSPR